MGHFSHVQGSSPLASTELSSCLDTFQSPFDPSMPASLVDRHNLSSGKPISRLCEMIWNIAIVGSRGDTHVGTCATILCLVPYVSKKIGVFVCLCSGCLALSPEASILIFTTPGFAMRGRRTVQSPASSYSVVLFFIFFYNNATRGF